MKEGNQVTRYLTTLPAGLLKIRSNYKRTLKDWIRPCRTGGSVGQVVQAKYHDIVLLADIYAPLCCRTSERTNERTDGQTGVNRGVRGAMCAPSDVSRALTTRITDVCHVHKSTTMRVCVRVRVRDSHTLLLKQKNRIHTHTPETFSMIIIILCWSLRVGERCNFENA